VNSLWKADDKSTSIILKQFHAYLEKGFTKSKALREAKLDYIKSNALYKSPAYWSHLILIGSDEPVCIKKQSYRGPVIAMLSFCFVFVVLVNRNKKKKKKSTISMDAGS
jgi:hypothetical protein